MKNFRKFLAVFLSIAMVMCSSLPSLASENHDATNETSETTKSKIEEQLKKDLGEERANKILNGESEEDVGASTASPEDETESDVGASTASPEEETESTVGDETEEGVGASTASPEEETNDSVGASTANPEDVGASTASPEDETESTVGDDILSSQEKETETEEGVGASSTSPEEEETNDSVGASTASPETETESTVAETTAEETTVAKATVSETAVEETTAAEATASPSDASLIEVEKATASVAKTLGMNPLAPPPIWMHFWLSDNGETIHYSKTEPTKVTDFYYVRQSDSIPRKYDDAGIDRTRIVKAVFENKIEADTCGSFFSSFYSLSYIENLEYLDTKNVNYMFDLFKECHSLEKLDLSSFDTGKVTSMIGMFSGCIELTDLDLSSFDTSDVTGMEDMFLNCKKIESLDLRYFNTEKVTDMNYMFSGCEKLTTILVSDSFNTENVSSSDDMFKDCSALKGGAGTPYDSNHINKEYARIDGVTSQPGYFTNASDVPWMYWRLEDNEQDMKTIVLSSTDKNGAIPITIDKFGVISYDLLNKDSVSKARFEDEIHAVTCGGMFYNFKKLKEIENISNLKTNRVTDMGMMFGYCYELGDLDISKFNTSNVGDMQYMFYGCPFKTLDFKNAKNFITDKVNVMNCMFRDCKQLEELDLRRFDTSKVTNMNGMFSSCKSLRTIYVSSSFEVNTPSRAELMFAECDNLIGGAGTTYDDSNPKDGTYARIDGGTSAPGYFTDAADAPWMYWYLTDEDENGVKTTINFSSSYKGGVDAKGIKGAGRINYDSLDKNTVTKAVFEDEIAAVTCEELFYQFKYLKEIQDLAKLKTNKVTNMISMFRECFSLESIDIEYLNTSNVENMKYMFYDCYGLTSLDVSHFITIKVKNMYGMFGLCTDLTDLNLNNFNTENVENMQQMFCNCQCLTYLDLSNFNTSKVTNMKDMFSGCFRLETIVVGNNFVTNTVTSSDNMFKYCTKLVGSYGTAYDENMIDKEYASIDNLDEYGRHHGYFSSAPWMYWYLGHNDTAIHYSSTKPASGGVGATRRDRMVYSGLSDEQREKITKATFEDRIDAKTCAQLFANFKDLTSIENLDNLNTTNVEDMSNMFYNCENLESIHVENLNVTNVKSTAGMFFGCKKLKSLELSGWNTENLDSTDLMFISCSALTLLDISTFDTSKVDSMTAMFRECTSLKELDLSNFDTARVKSMVHMFKDCSSLERIYVSNDFVTTAVIDDTGMFEGCTSIKGSRGTTYDESHTGKEYARIDGGTAAPGYFYTNDWMWYKYDDTQKTLYLYGTEPNDFDYVVSGSGPISYRFTKGSVEKVVFENEVRARTCESMFEEFYELVKIVSLENLNTSSVMSMKLMFSFCQKLDKVDLSKFDTSKVTDMTGMFANCSGLDELDVTSFDTSNAIEMYGMFLGCSNLTTLDLTKFDTKNVTNLTEFLNGCEELTSIDLSSFDTSNVVHIGDMFVGCAKLETITASSKFVTTKAIFDANMFNGCVSLVGGAGTTYDPSRISMEYARIDGGPTSATPGYFTRGNWMWWYLDNTGKVLHLTNSDPKNGKATGINSGDTVTYENLDKTRVTKVKFDDYIVADTCNNFFAGFTKLVEIEGLNQLEVEFANKMSRMFSDCESLKSIDMSNFYTSNITEMACMFEGCSSLTSLDFSKAGDFDTSNVVDMKDMFNGCKKLTTLDLSLFETAKVQYMEGKFSGCSALKSIIVSPGFDTSSVVDDGGFMFKNCTSIVGGKGTTYSADHTNYEYARIDEGPNSLYPGYFTLSGATNVVSISIISNPNKTIYTAGQTLNPAGLKIKAVYSDGSYKEITYTSGNANEFTFSPSLSTKLTTSDRLVTVTYGGQSTTFAITVRQSGGGNSGDSGSSSGSSGGGGGGGPTIAEDVPGITYLNATSAILGVFASSSSNWSYDPVDNSWQLNSTDANGNAVRAINGLYALTHVRTHIVNGVPMETIVTSVYCLNANAKMVTGWVKTLDGKWFFFENKKNADEGKMVTGWKQIQGAWYYFGEDGAMYINTVTPDGYRVGADGKLIQ